MTTASRRTDPSRRNPDTDSPPSDNLTSAAAAALRQDGQVMQDALLERQLHFQYLVRRYFLQIRFGCHEQSCSTPSCLGYKKRLEGKPFQRPTILTARALAFHLASQSNAVTGLCPYPQVVACDALQVAGSSSAKHVSNSLASKSPAQSSHLSKSPHDESLHNITSAIKKRGTCKRSKSVSFSDPEVSSYHSSEAIKLQQQTKKDFSSLTQTLFDTNAMVSFIGKDLTSAENGLPSKPNAEANGYPRNGNMSLHVPATTGTTESSLSAPTQDLRSLGSTINASEKDAVNHNHTMHSTDLSITNGVSPVIQKDGPPRLNGIGRRKSSFTQPLKSKLKRSPSAMTEVHGEVDQLSEDEFVQSNYIAPSNLSCPTSNSARSRTPNSHSTLEAHHSDAKGPHLDDGMFTSGLTTSLMKSFKNMKISGGRHQYEEGKSKENELFFNPLDYKSIYGDDRQLNMSMYYCLSNPSILLRSFREEETWEMRSLSPLPHLHPIHMDQAFQSWTSVNDSLVFDSLWHAVKALFEPPPELDVQKSPKLNVMGKIDSHNDKIPCTNRSSYLSDTDAAHIVMVCIHALTSFVPRSAPRIWLLACESRQKGNITPFNFIYSPKTGSMRSLGPITDALEYEPALRLASRLIRAIASRRCFSEILEKLLNTNSENSGKSGNFGLMHLLVNHLFCVTNQRGLTSIGEVFEDSGPRLVLGWSIVGAFIEFLRTLIIKNWDGKPEVNRWGVVGGAIEILSDLHRHREQLGAPHEKFPLPETTFEIPFLSERLDLTETATAYLSWKPNPNTLHLLLYPFLFSRSTLVSYFRAMNYATIYGQHEEARRTVRMQRLYAYCLDPRRRNAVEQRLNIALEGYLYLNIRRGHALEDISDQLWRMERRQLMKPLKVGIENEEGVDQGGVSVEFFTVVLSEAFNADNGMFVVDPQTRMTWFQPCSLEPLHRFELIGLLFSLAIHNGITLPITFPNALYQHLSGQAPKSLNDIKDGWPTLAKGLDELLNWTDGDVEDIFCRSYVFSFEAFGETVHIDMNKHADDEPWPTSNPGSPLDISSISMSAEELDSLPLVSNLNRQNYVEDYIFWLTDKSIRPQMAAFTRGFFACLDRTALSLFNPSLLQTVIEGHQGIDIDELRKSARYENGYGPDHPYIEQFWNIVSGYSQNDRKRLLEFVTATTRVPVNGISSVVFSVERNGPDTEMLPTSSTCFGKLLLPEYESMEKLRQKLRVALDNSKGFGAL